MAASEHVQYDPQYVQQVYAETYASFQALPGFAKEKRFLRHRFQLVLRAAQVRIPAEASYMDLGCGLGLKTRIIADFFSQSTGLDFAERCIQIASLLNDKKGLQFVHADATQGGQARYDFVSAFGLSVFNVHDKEECAQGIEKAVRDHCKPGGVFMVYSFTDFSGKAPTGWVNHKTSDLHFIQTRLAQQGWKVQVVFPHRKLGNYLGNGPGHLIGELGKLLSRKRRDYYIVIETPRTGS